MRIFLMKDEKTLIHYLVPADCIGEAEGLLSGQQPGKYVCVSTSKEFSQKDRKPIAMIEINSMVRLSKMVRIELQTSQLPEGK